MTELYRALTKTQSELTCVPKDAVNPHYRSRYATLASTWDAIRIILTKNNLSIIQYGKIIDGGNLILVTRMQHISGEFVESELPILNGKGDMQGIGSAWSYARRYSLQAIVGIAADDDDDANNSLPNKYPPPLPAAIKPKNVLKETKENKQAASASPKDYVPSFGPFKDIPLGNTDPHLLREYCIHVLKEAESSGKEIKGRVKEFIEAADLYLGSMPPLFEDDLGPGTAWIDEKQTIIEGK